MNPPVATASQPLALREFHAFEAHGARFLYMVPSAGIFRMDGPSVAILDALQLFSTDCIPPHSPHEARSPTAESQFQKCEIVARE